MDSIDAIDSWDQREVEGVCDLLAAAEQAALTGHRHRADYCLHRAEQAALALGRLSLIRLIWRHSAPARTIPA